MIILTQDKRQIIECKELRIEEHNGKYPFCIKAVVDHGDLYSDDVRLAGVYESEEAALKVFDWFSRNDMECFCMPGSDLKLKGV